MIRTRKMVKIEMNDNESSVYTSDIEEEDRREEDQATRRIKNKNWNPTTILHEVMSTLESTGFYGHLSLYHISMTQRPEDSSKDRVYQDMRYGAVLRDEACVDGFKKKKMER